MPNERSQSLRFYTVVFYTICISRSNLQACKNYINGCLELVVGVGGEGSSRTGTAWWKEAIPGEGCCGCHLQDRWKWWADLTCKHQYPEELHWAETSWEHDASRMSRFKIRKQCSPPARELQLQTIINTEVFACFPFSSPHSKNQELAHRQSGNTIWGSNHNASNFGILGRL